MTNYNKLVRDKIPEIIQKDGYHPEIRILSDEEYIKELEIKLDEECQEFHDSKQIDELADLLEVLLALNEAYGHSLDELVDVYHKKHELRGGFKDKIYLISKIDSSYEKD